jgi:CBS domain containing-hemolysin-like protein
VLAEVVPITYAAANAERVARAVARPVGAANWLLFLPSRALGFLAERLANLLGGKPHPESPVTEGEIRAIVDLQTAAGGLEEEEKVMIHSIFEFGDTVAREVMVPRTQMVALPDTATIREAAAASTEHRLSRLPVYRRDLDDIVGVVYAKDLLPRLVAGKREEAVTSVMKPPFIVPETRKLSDLLTDFRRLRKTVAIIVDEYGGAAGLVTREDLLEEVVGDIWDEYDVVRPAVERVGEDEFVLDGKTSIDEASEALGVELPEGEYDSVAGLLYSRLGVVEVAGESVTVNGVAFTIEQLDGRRIARVRAKVQ